MYPTLEAVRTAMVRDGWSYYTPFWYRKFVSGRFIWAEVEKDSDGYFTSIREDIEL